MSQNFEKENSTEEINHPVNMNDQDETDELLTDKQIIIGLLKGLLVIAVLYLIIFSYRFQNILINKSKKIIN